MCVYYAHIQTYLNFQVDIVNKTFTHYAEEEECKGSVGYFYQTLNISNSSFIFCPKGAPYKKSAFFRNTSTKGEAICHLTTKGHPYFILAPLR